MLKFYKRKDEFLEQLNDTTTQIELAKKTAAAHVVSPVEEYAPVGIWTRVEASRGLHDWPLHYGSKKAIFLSTWSDLDNCNFLVFV